VHFIQYRNFFHQLREHNCFDPVSPKGYVVTSKSESDLSKLFKSPFYGCNSKKCAIILIMGRNKGSKNKPKLSVEEQNKLGDRWIEKSMM